MQQEEDGDLENISENHNQEISESMRLEMEYNSVSDRAWKSHLYIFHETIVSFFYDLTYLTGMIEKKGALYIYMMGMAHLFLLVTGIFSEERGRAGKKTGWNQNEPCTKQNIITTNC